MVVESSDLLDCKTKPRQGKCQGWRSRNHIHGDSRGPLKNGGDAAGSTQRLSIDYLAELALPRPRTKRTEHMQSSVEIIRVCQVHRKWGWRQMAKKSTCSMHFCHANEFGLGLFLSNLSTRLGSVVRPQQ
mmetsp:Transcript_20180/g.44048  ORF Transcript_20180/g.44048 Transcript_20180/m.44048 type:complete len:130 (+) Transcript_20180:233-622(+)